MNIFVPETKHHALTYIHSQRFQKLRKMSIEEDTSATSLDDGRTDAPITPAPKRGRGRPAKKRKVEDSEQDSEEEKPAQAKRGRKPNTTIKNEDDEDGAMENELAKAKPVRVTRSKKTDAIVKEEVKEEESEDGAEEDAAITGADADSSETITAGADEYVDCIESLFFRKHSC